MIHILSETNSVANQFLFELRSKDIQNDRARFRHNLKRLGWVMAYELSKTLHYEQKDLITPLASMHMPVIALDPVIITILRAATPFMEGFLDIFHHSEVGFVGAYRKKGTEEVEISADYYALPDVINRDVIVVDPMLATGKSMVKVVKQLCENGLPAHLYLACAVAAPEGIDYVTDQLNDFPATIWAGAVDLYLNDKSYIVPGLGDAGDLCYGPKN